MKNVGVLFVMALGVNVPDVWCLRVCLKSIGACLVLTVNREAIREQYKKLRKPVCPSCSLWWVTIYAVPFIESVCIIGARGGVDILLPRCSTTWRNRDLSWCVLVCIMCFHWPNYEGWYDVLPAGHLCCKAYCLSKAKLGMPLSERKVLRLENNCMQVHSTTLN